jgi:HPt (histidine-containing phosphotransfer) domain-containing protein
VINDPSQPGAPANANLNEALDRLWERFLPEIEDRVEVIAAAAALLDEGNLEAPDREAAHAAAHKLAGVLGAFGLARGTELARQLELAFSNEGMERASAARLSATVAELRALIESRKAR